MPPPLSKLESDVAKQYAKWQAADEEAHALWEKVDREAKKLVKLAKMGRRARAVVRISEFRGLELKNQFRGPDTEKVFAPAFARKWKFKEVTIDAG
jgi:hypothetical protein